MISRPRDAFGRFISAKAALLAAKMQKLNTPEGQPSPTSPKVSFGSDYHTAQIYSQGMEFAFMSQIAEVYTQICTFVFCKDFLHDLVWSFLNQKRWGVYNFTYDPAKDLPLDLSCCALAVRNLQLKDSSEEFHSHLTACQDFLNQVERTVGFQPTQIHKVSHDKGPCWLIIGDKAWQHAPPLLGLFALFIRVGYYHTLGEDYAVTLKGFKSGEKGANPTRGGVVGVNDPKYVKTAEAGIRAFLEHGLDNFCEKIEENYPQKLPKNLSLHDFVGPVGWSQGSARKAMPRWYKYLPAEKKESKELVDF